MFSKNGLHFFISFLALIILNNGLGQGLPLPFKTISVEDGLPQNSITALVQDDQGYLWIGTQDGLAKYDGYEFSVYRHDKNNPNSLSHNFVWNITKDSFGILWITTLGNGLTRLDPSTDEFTQFCYNEQEGVGLSHWNTFSSYQKDSILYVGTNESLDKIDLCTNSTSTYFPGLEFGKDSVTSLIRAIVPDGNSGKLWLSTKLGLTRFDTQSESFEYFPNSPFGNKVNLRNILTLTPQDDSLIVCTANHVVSLNFETGREQILLEGASLGTEKSSRFHGFMRGNGYSDFIFSGNGIFERNRNTGEISHHYYDPQDRESLSHDYVISMLQTRDGALWAGTRNGLSTIRYRDAGFTRFGKTKENGKSLVGKGVKGFAECNDSLLLVATSEGIEVVNLITGRVNPLEDFSTGTIPAKSKYTLSLLQDSHGTIWSGSRGGGLIRIDRTDEGSLRINEPDLGEASIQFILDDDSLLWLGSSGLGLLKYSKDRGLTKSFSYSGDSLGPSHPYVYCLLIDSQGNFWLGTPTGGINFFDRAKEEFIHLIEYAESGLSGNTILCIFQDSEGTIRIGTSTGLSKLVTPLVRDLAEKLRTDSFQLRFDHFGREAGFPNEVIYGIVEDESGILWISTNDGLVKFDKAQGKVLNAFHRNDGTQTDEYNQNAFLELNNGFIAFGGVSGFQIFHPDSLSLSAIPPKIVFTNIQIDKEPWHLSEKPFELDYNQNDVSVEFAALSYVNSGENTYRYRLMGFDESWYDRKSNRLATYTNLDPGNYQFEVLAANCDGAWTKEPKTLAFSIGTPPWLSWYAYIGYTLLACMGIYFVIKLRTDQVRKVERRKLELEAARTEERELFRKRSALDFHDQAGNKITRINLLVELAKSHAKENNQLSDYLAKIARNTSELSRGMRDFNWALDPEKDSVLDLLERIKAFGESMYEGEKAQFQMRGLDEDFQNFKIPMAMRRDVLMIFKEAINNAVKHSESDHGCFEITSDA